MADLPGIGNLRQRIRLVRRTRAPDLEFGFDEELAELGHVWAEMEQVGNMTLLDDATDDSTPGVTHVFTVRRDPLVNRPDARTYLIHEGRRFKIVRVRDEDQTGRFIALLCVVEQTETPP